MARRTKRMIILAAALLSGGCGTVANVALPLEASVNVGPEASFEEKAASRINCPPPRLVYGGVQFDYSVLCSLARGRWSYLNLIYVPMATLDLPLSAVGDTVTLPVTLARLLSGREAGIPDPPAPLPTER
ncbi:YceK/YidQ family lipoprotein [Limnoglobus roseus]|uniref:YceK/YidQ family lipoprotein n=1 Tax=Limnoglobus roseus TaxID=2598579 RepID=A0A5C1ACW9_9BACT|nr:YceK/YidQ family lipoprotein [Limnoglobus roseus]QEL14898.1 YceK/YidQ family lipoprotein [Limnoglobus roseus]